MALAHSTGKLCLVRLDEDMQPEASQPDPSLPQESEQNAIPLQDALTIATQGCTTGSLFQPANSESKWSRTQGNS